MQRRRKALLKVLALIEGIEAGDDIPPVFVTPHQDTYRLCVYGEPHNQGGHNRTLAHYLLGRDMPCTVIDDQPSYVTGTPGTLKLLHFPRLTYKNIVRPNQAWRAPDQKKLEAITEHFYSDSPHRVVFAHDLRDFFQDTFLVA